MQTQRLLSAAAIVAFLTSCSSGSNVTPVPTTSGPSVRTMSVPAGATIQFDITVPTSGPPTSTISMTSGGVTVMTGNCIEGSRLSATVPQPPVEIIHTSRLCNVTSPSGQTGSLLFGWQGQTTAASGFTNFSGSGVMNHGTGFFATYQGTFSVNAVINFGVGAAETWTGQFHT